jgi:hypothetical protein
MSAITSERQFVTETVRDLTIISSSGLPDALVLWPSDSLTITATDLIVQVGDETTTYERRNVFARRLRTREQRREVTPAPVLSHETLDRQP